MKLILFSILSLIVLSSTITGIALAESHDENLIPVWIKVIAREWSQSNISDPEYIQSLEWMITNNIIVLDDSQLSQIPLAETEKMLYKQEIRTLKNTISILENNIISQDEMYDDMVSLEEQMQEWKGKYDDEKNEFRQYREDYPLKVGNIGGELVNVDAVKALQQQIEDTRAYSDTLKTELNDLEKEFKEYKKEHPAN